MDKTIAVIPARMASTRLPGKPLADICGLPMVEHVRRRTEMARNIDSVIVATCDEEIYKVVNGYGGVARMTSPKHETCIDRVAEVVQNIACKNVVIVQGDEPLVHPGPITTVAFVVIAGNFYCATLIERIDEKDVYNENIVKVVTNNKWDVMHFSRFPIPSQEPDMTYRQVGVIGFRKHDLLDFVNTPQGELEKKEHIDLLRAIEHNHTVKGIRALASAHKYSKTVGVDTEEDLKLARKLMEKDPLFDKCFSTELYPPDSFSSNTGGHALSGGLW